MAHRGGYDVVVDVDAEVYAVLPARKRTTDETCRRQGDLGHTDLNDDLEFHDSSTIVHRTPNYLLRP